jgi:signal transduction histidine kinase
MTLDATIEPRLRARILEAADAERQRLERNLHDGAQQRLVSLGLRLSLLATRLETDSEAGRMLAAAREELAGSLEELRELARGLNPATLVAGGLVEAVQSLAARAALPVWVTSDLTRRPPARVEVAAYYVICEALANVAKYADATTVAIDLSLRDRRLVVEIVDDGVGGAAPGEGSGLRGLVDRVEALGGRLEVVSPRGRGTTVRAEVPCAPSSLRPPHDRLPAPLAAAELPCA